MWIPDAVAGELATLLREAVTARLLAERSRLAAPGERAWNAAPWLLLAAQLEQMSANGPGTFTPRLVGIDDWATANGVSPRHARRLCRAGRVPGAVRHAGRWLIVEEAPPWPTRST